MNLNTAISLLASTCIGGAIVAVSVEDLTNIHSHATGELARVQERNDAQVLEAAQIMFELSGGPARATPQALVAAGYLKPSFLTRERVQAVATTPAQ